MTTSTDTKPSVSMGRRVIWAALGIAWVILGISVAGHDKWLGIAMIALGLVQCIVGGYYVIRERSNHEVL